MNKNIIKAFFNSLYTIEVVANEVINKYSLFCNNELIEEKSVNSNNFTINSDLINFNNFYYLIINNKTKIYVTYEGIYDTEEFNRHFANNEQLGNIYKKKKTIFRVWAPSQQKIEVAFYKNGGVSLNKNQVIKTVEMAKKKNGNIEKNTLC